MTPVVAGPVPGYSRSMRGGWLLVAMLAGLVGCAAMEEAEKRDRRDFSAERLGEPDPESSILADSLDEQERAAAHRAGIEVSGHAGADDPDAPRTTVSATGEDVPAESDPDKAGKIGVALLSVGVTVGMLVAPFFLM